MEVQPTAREPEYAIGDTVWFFKAPNSDGAARVAALSGKWQEGVVTDHIIEEASFLLYAGSPPDGTLKGRFAGAHVNPRADPLALQIHFLATPVDWCNVRTAMTLGKRRYTQLH